MINFCGNLSITCILLFSSTGWAAWSYPSCVDVTENDFTAEIIIAKTADSGGLVIDATLDEPLKMALNLNTNGHVDIYFVERRGNLKFYNGTTKNVSVIGHIDVFHKEYLRTVPPSKINWVEEGLGGIALDPEFNSNRYIYLTYNPIEKNVFRLARFYWQILPMAFYPVKTRYPG